MTDYAKDVLVSTDWVAEHLERRPGSHRRGRREPGPLRRGPHPRRHRLRLETRPAGPGAQELPRAGGVRRADGQPRHLQRAHRGPLRRPEQLVRGLHLLVLPLLRARGREADERSAREVDRRGVARPRAMCRAYDGGLLRAADGRLDPCAARPVEAALGTPRPGSVDVRSPAEFAGEIISPNGYEQEGAQRGGHIPGAASVPWSERRGKRTGPSSPPMSSPSSTPSAP